MLVRFSAAETRTYEEDNLTRRRNSFLKGQLAAALAILISRIAIMPTVTRLSLERVGSDHAVRTTQQPRLFPIRCVEDVLPKLLDTIFGKLPEFIGDHEKSAFLLALHERLSRSSYTLGAKDDKNVLTYRPKGNDEIGNIRRGAISFSTDLGLQLLSDQTIGTISLQSGLSDPTDPAQLRSCREIVIHVQERDPYGPIAEVTRIAEELRSHWLESAGFNSRLLRGLNCTVFDCVVMALSSFGIVREDLPGLRWGTPASGIKNIRRRFFTNNPDLTAEINQTEYPDRLQRMSASQLGELRRKVKHRMTRANIKAWRLDGYRHVRQFRSLTLQEVAERCFPFMTLPIFETSADFYSSLPAS